MRIAGRQVPLWAVIALVVTLAAIVVAVLVGRGDVESAEGPGLSAGSSGEPGVTGSDAASAGIEPSGGKATTTDTASTDTGSGSVGPDGDGDGAAKTGTVIVKFWDDTSSRYKGGATIKLGDAVWSPDAGESDTSKMGPVELGTTVTLYVYPDGQDGAEIAVPIVVTTAMSGRDADAVHVELRDTEVRVLGNPVVNFEVLESRG